jgi:hypothetical protein
MNMKTMEEMSNLITDMTVNGATEAELARAVKHSMAVIDVEKSAIDNNITVLVNKYSKEV